MVVYRYCISYYLDAATLVKLMVSPHAESYISCVQPFNSFAILTNNLPLCTWQILHYVHDFAIHLCHNTLNTLDRGS